MSDDNSTNTTATSVTSSLAELPLSPGDRELDPLVSIDTGNPDRDAHTRSADLLDVAKRPTMSFRSTRVSGADEGWTMEGDLTIGDVTRPITFAVEVGGVAVFPPGPAEPRRLRGDRRDPPQRLRPGLRHRAPQRRGQDPPGHAVHRTGGRGRLTAGHCSTTPSTPRESAASGRPSERAEGYAA
ncbi:YceI family protein [Streptomyces sp. GQFP]|uniref:YceI family protein n=1 Tax=Streptomyces sp. GQFP TaxID=2907545 RepID=UPI001F3B0B46|nr:YceI family protein [Streptomyces sp. GQFP]